FDEHQARLAVVVDVTDRKRMSAEKETLERQLWQAQKLEAVGQLAGGIAHDFNNLLAVMLNYISFVKAELDPSSSEYEDLGEAMSAGERAAQLVEHLLTFSRRELVSPEVLDVNVVVRDMEKILRRSVKESVDLKITAGDDLWRSKIDRGRLEQVLVNLVVNADAAMPDGGVLEISTRNNAIDEVAASHRAELEAGDYVRLSVSDTGLGMPAEVASHIFEPFFTTKPVGEGTGLGLATVYGVVKKAGGYIYVYSEEGCGSTFNIYLPATTSPADLRIEESVAEPAGGTETVLVVEDEAGVRDIAVRILTEAGYQVMSAGDPLDALEMVRTDGSHIDLVLTDVIMPNLSGKALVERLRNKRAGLRVLYMSGYTDEVIANQGVLDPGVRLLQKPFDARALLSAVREALNDDLAVVDVPQKRRVLVVDDEAPMRQVLRLFLETNGFLVVGEAEDAPSAIEMARTLDPDLIVLDHLLHGMTGGDAAPMLRVCAPDTRILAFSAALDAKPEWADGWLTKERIAEMVPALEELVPA
ncbi:MAG TPA: response regulator, partial [Actinomycetota bacterium]|nr:response regulator [Actinomycetota bacterium]